MKAIQQFSHSPFNPNLQLIISDFASLPAPSFRIDQSLPYRLPFYAVVLATGGAMSFEIDFAQYHLKQGDVMLLPPNKVLKLSPQADWQGLVLRFSPEFLLPTGVNVLEDKLFSEVKRLPLILPLSPAQFDYFHHLLQQIEQAQGLFEPSAEWQNMLRHQLYSLLNGLVILGKDQLANREGKRFKRFRQFETLLEEQFRQHHRLSDYARQLACTERSLTLASLEVTGLPAKTLISERLALEAKRQLIYTSQPIAALAEYLGFDDTANFIRFFKKNVGTTPLRFRKGESV